jgi:hypothetical protein
MNIGYVRKKEFISYWSLHGEYEQGPFRCVPRNKIVVFLKTAPLILKTSVIYETHVHKCVGDVAGR